MLDKNSKLVGSICFFLAAMGIIGAIYRYDHATPFLLFAGTTAIVGLLVLTGHKIGSIKLGPKGGELVAQEEPVPLTPAQPLISKEQHAERREEIRRTKPPAPGLIGPVKPFQLLDDPAAVRPMPGADPSVPVYRLDKEFRILDWNEAFTLAFDGSIEGRKGQNAQEWVFFLDNYEEVMNHGIEKFGDPQDLPRVDFELLKYTSRRYGAFEAGKRAYQVPSVDGSVDSWVCVLDLKFPNPSVALKFQLDLISVLRDDLLWSEYAVVYDRVLTNTEVYKELLSEILGESKRAGALDPVSPTAKVLDLGAGTGNLTLRLLEESDRRSVVAMDKNRFMLGALRLKCERYLQNTRGKPGVLPLKQDITNLYGLPDDYFDVAILNNVLYSITEAEKCLREVYRVLKPGGQIRLSGPKKTTDLNPLLTRIKSDIQAAGQWEELSEDFARVDQINRFRLSPWLYRWSPQDLEQLLRATEFVGESDGRLWQSENVYEGQAVIFRAFKPR